MATAKKETEKKPSKAGTWTIPVRSISGNSNPRFPLSDAIKLAGYGIFKLQPESTLPTVWELATSPDPERRKQYCDLIAEHDPEFAGWASTFLTQGQLQPAECREGGSGKFTLVFGCRRALAILYNWCLLGKPAEPVIEVKLVKGNETDLLHRAFTENTRKNPNAIEDARSIRMAMNAGEEAAAIAQARGISEQTIKNRLALLELPIKKQQQIEAGTLKPTKALASLRHANNGDGTEEASDNAESNGETSQPKAKRRSAKEVREAMNEFAESTPIHKFAAWVLGEREDF